MRKRNIVLASASPRRSELMHMLGFSDVIVHPAKGEEQAPKGASPEETVKALSRSKAEEVAALFGPDALVIAADTIVWLDGEILGKPHSEEQAFAMLRRLSGREHEVYTGVTVLDGEGELCEAERSVVHFRELADEEIRRYIGKILMDALVAERGAENVVYIPKTVEVGENAVKITGDSIAVCVGTITNKEGYVVDVVVIVGMTVKNWNDVARKDDKVTLAINMDDIRDAVKGLE